MQLLRSIINIILTIFKRYLPISIKAHFDLVSFLRWYDIYSKCNNFSKPNYVILGYRNLIDNLFCSRFRIKNKNMLKYLNLTNSTNVHSGLYFQLLLLKKILLGRNFPLAYCTALYLIISSKKLISSNFKNKTLINERNIK